MKNILKLFAVGAFAFTISGCSDFEEVNRNPQALDDLANKPYYALNNSIMIVQQNPDVAERLFVINWAAPSRQDGEDGYGTNLGQSSDGYVTSPYNNICDAIKYAVNTISLCDLQLEESVDITEHERAFYPNLRAFATIWKVYAMSEFTDTFGPMPIHGFEGVNPDFNSVQEVYYYFYDELAQAIPQINVDVTPTTEEAACDAAYGYDPVKWKAYGISLWMRLAMRLSEADPARAKSEFEKAVNAGSGIITNDQIFSVQEKSGWDNLSGVMSRSWNIQNMSATMANLTTNLGDVNAMDILDGSSKILYANYDKTRYENKIKDAATYLGRKYENHFLDNSDNPTKQYFFDGIPSRIDPRAFIYFFMSGDSEYRLEASDANGNFEAYTFDEVSMYDEAGNAIEGTEIDPNFCWNGMPVCYQADESVTYNGLFRDNAYVGAYPALAHKYRNNSLRRVFFGPWETYFLLAEAAVRGWNAGIDAKTAYETGIRLSFEYNDVDEYLDDYLTSTSYNRVGTSVSFDHTDEPEDYPITSINGYTGEESTVTYHYPNAENILYEGGKLNDHLTKIITQKYIANTPWLPLENYSDHRRLGLPFFEIPASTLALQYLPEWTVTSYQGKQKPGYFVQRTPYPMSLPNADPDGYQKAIELLGGPDNMTTPLWWAIGGHE